MTALLLGSANPILARSLLVHRSLFPPALQIVKLATCIRLLT